MAHTSINTVNSLRVAIENAISKAIKNGELSKTRLESYRKIKSEAKYSEDSFDYRKQKQQWEKALKIGDKKRKKERF